MAWTFVKVADYAVGNHKTQHWTASADSATANLVTGLNNVLSVIISPKSATTTTHKASASGGTIAVISSASGDELFITVVGN